MRTFKGFDTNLQATLGKGIFQYEPGITYREEKSKTRSTGFHAAEYIIDCMRFYRMDGKNRFFLCESAGSIDEEESCSMVVSTELTLEKELNMYEIAYYAIVYMVEHPKREWKYEDAFVTVGEEADPKETTQITIIRSTEPVAYGKQGILGFLLEDTKGEIIAARVVQIGRNAKADTNYTITKTGQLKEVAG